MMTSYDQVAWAAVIQPMGNRYNMPCPNQSRWWNRLVPVQRLVQKPVQKLVQTGSQKLNGGRIGKLEGEPKVFCEAAIFADLKHFKKEHFEV